jgi:hypothetical protein
MRSRNSQRVSLPSFWVKFATNYGRDRAYWYTPKELAAAPQAIKARLEVLRKFERAGDWRDIQGDYIAALREAKISDAEAEWQGGGAPLARMLKQVFTVLGLAWVDSNDQVELTKEGELFLEADDPGKVLSGQMFRYQFWNRAIRSKAHQLIKLHPIPFLAELMRTLSPPHITAAEYELFVARARAQADVDDVVEKIERFRSLSGDEQASLIQRCDRYMLGGSRRSSIYNTISLNRAYAFRMIQLSDLIGRSADGSLILNRTQLRDYRRLLSEFAREGAYIEFANQKDWMAYMGSPDQQPTRVTALEYYLSKGDVKRAVATQKASNLPSTELKKFRDMLVSEKQVEDYLERNLDEIEAHIGYQLELIGRQYSTTVGPIDLLARDRKSSTYVVIEVKKGRSADRVYGQTSRYMGWVRQNLAGGRDVVGVIVARSIDDKLKAARDAHHTKVALVEFEMKFGSRSV